MSLPFDYARCFDDLCPRRDECPRWLERENRGPRTPCVSTLRCMPGCLMWDGAQELMGGHSLRSQSNSK